MIWKFIVKYCQSVFNFPALSVRQFPSHDKPPYDKTLSNAPYSAQAKWGDTWGRLASRSNPRCFVLPADRLAKERKERKAFILIECDGDPRWRPREIMRLARRELNRRDSTADRRTLMETLTAQYFFVGGGGGRLPSGRLPWSGRSRPGRLPAVPALVYFDDNT